MEINSIKRCSESEIMAANSSEQIFSSDLETIEKEKNNYLETFKPKDYNNVRNYVVMKKILLLYNEAIEKIAIQNGEEVETVQNIAETKTKAQKNYEAINNIFETCKDVLMSLNHIADEDERKNKLDEYYMLQREITNLEDKLSQMGNVKKAYSEISIEEIPTVQMNNLDIKFILEGCNNETLEKIKILSKGNLCSPMEIVFSLLANSTIFIVPMYWDEDTDFAIKIAGIDIEWMKTTDMFLIDKSFIIGGFKEKNIVKGGLCYKTNHDLRYIINTWMEYINHNYCKESIEKQKEIFVTNAKVQLEKKLGEKGAIKLIESIQKEIEKEECLEGFNQEAIYEFKAFLSCLNIDIVLSNLRKVHGELKRVVRKYKLEREIY